MDPLGAIPGIVDYKTLTRWNATDVPQYDIMLDDPSSRKISPFKFDATLNEKIILWNGDITQLNAEAITNSTNESLNDKNPTSERILTRAGSDLRRELRNVVKGCRTGEALMSKGYRLPARYIVHTVGPKYNIKYKTAAESALYSACRSVLYVVREHKIRSLAMSCIHTMRRGYPSHEGAHIEIRTVRRFLEKFGDSIDTIVFVVTGADEDTYQSHMPLYFPRSESEEEFAAYHQPYDIGDADGEPVIAERQIRITGKPMLPPKQTDRIHSFEDLEESVDINDVFQASVAVGNHAFAKMEGDFDRSRKQKVMRKTQAALDDQYEAERRKRYERRLQRAMQADLADVNALRFLYWSGFDKHGRRVVVVVGRHFPANTVDYEKAMLYVIHTLDPIVDRPYVVVYFHTLSTGDNLPYTQFFKDLYNTFDQRYFKNLKAIYMVHTSVFSKVMTWFMTTFTLNAIKEKVQYIPGLEYLYTRIPHDQLDLPGFVLQYDIKELGTRYYRPEEDHAIGSL